MLLIITLALLPLCFCGEDSPPSDGMMRLANVQGDGVGILQVYFNGEWGGMCSEGWSQGSTQVVCRQWGQDSSDAMWYPKTDFTTIKYWGKGFYCNGGEPYLGACTQNPGMSGTVKSCPMNSSVWMRCEKPFDPATLIPAAMLLASPKDLLVLDCAGVLHINPGNNVMRMAIKIPGLRDILPAMNARAKAAVQCHCAAVTDAIYNADLAMTPEALLTGLHRSTEAYNYTALCPPEGLNFGWSKIGTMFHGADFLGTNDSCSAAWLDGLNATTYSAGTAVGFNVKLPFSGAMNLKVAVKKCPNAVAGSMPFISATCEGDDCGAFMRLCHQDSDCGVNGLTCFSLNDTAPADLWQFLNESGLYPVLDACVGHFSAGNESIGSWFLDQIYTNWNALIAQTVDQPAHISGLGFCGFKNLIEGQNDVNCSNFESWTPDASFVSPERLNGSAFPALAPLPAAAGAFLPLLDVGCDGKFSLYPTSPLHIRGILPDYPALFNALSEIIRTMADCRLGGLTDNQFSTRFLPQQLFMWLYAFEHESDFAKSFELGQTGSDLVSKLIDALNTSVIFPPKCNFETLVNNGTCVLDLGFLHKLLNKNVYLHVNVSSCPNPTHPPSFTVSCVGEDLTNNGDCAEVFGVDHIFQWCKTDADCPSEACGHFNIQDPMGGLYWNKVNDTIDTCSNGPMMENVLLNFIKSHYVTNMTTIPAPAMNVHYGLCAPMAWKDFNMTEVGASLLEVVDDKTFLREFPRPCPCHWDDVMSQIQILKEAGRYRPVVPV